MLCLYFVRIFGCYHPISESPPRVIPFTFEAPSREYVFDLFYGLTIHSLPSTSLRIRRSGLSKSGEFMFCEELMASYLYMF